MALLWVTPGVTRVDSLSISQFFFHILTSFSGMQVPCRCPTSVSGMQVPCRYRDQCRGYAGTLQVSWPVSGVYIYHASILTSARGRQKLAHIESLTQRFSWYVIRRLSVCTLVPHSEGNFTDGPPLYNVMIQNRWRCHEKQSFARTGNRTRDPSSSLSARSTKTSVRSSRK